MAALRPDVTVVNAQRADREGNTQIWGIVGAQREAALAARRVIVVVEEVVDEAVARADPDRTRIPGVAVDAVVEEPFSAHPSFAQGHYDRDNAAYLAGRGEPLRGAPRPVPGRMGLRLPDRAAYRERLGAEALARLRPAAPRPAGPVDYGDYR